MQKVNPLAPAIDIRATEFAILDQSDPEYDNIVVVPESQLRTGELIQDESLPFSIRCTKFYDNSRLAMAKTPIEGIKGIGRMADLTELPPNTDEQVDLASARVELISKDGVPMGTYTVSQLLREFAGHHRSRRH